MKTVKIPLSLFELLLDFFENLEFRSILMDLYTPDFLSLYDELGRELRRKHDAILKREIYSQYKNATDLKQREEFRKKYLDCAEIPHGFRSSVEIKDDIPF